jgi:hypothetical protein
MNRRELLQNSAALSVATAIPLAASGLAISADSAGTPGVPGAAAAVEPSRFRPPAEGSIPVAFLISRGAVVIDFCRGKSSRPSVSQGARMPRSTFTPWPRR